MNTKIGQLYGIGNDVEVRRINMQIVMKLQKTNDTLGIRNLCKILNESDVNGNGYMN